MISPLISVIVPTYNRGNLIIDTLNSIKSQSYSNWECYIVDDESTDNSVEIVKEYIKSDSRFKLINNKRKKGAQGARNTGLLCSFGEYICFFDSDNIMHRERFSKQLKYLEENPKCDICTCYSHLVNDENQIIGAFTWITIGNILKELLDGSTYVDFNSSILRKIAITKIGLLDEDCPSFQEWDTNIRLAAVSQYGTVNEILVSYYQRSEGRLSNNKKVEINGLAYIYAKHKRLWIDELGKSNYFLNLYKLKSRISFEDKIFQKEVATILPDLSNLPIRFRMMSFKNKLIRFLLRFM